MTKIFRMTNDSRKNFDQLLFFFFLLILFPQAGFSQPAWVYDADNLLLSAPAAGGLPGLSPIVHDAPSGKVLRAGDKAFTYDAWGRVKTVSLVSGSGGGGGDEPPVGDGSGGGYGGTGSGVFAKTTGVDNHASLGGNATVTDHLGSVVTLLNSSGAPAQQNSFDPFGQVISSTSSNGFGGQPYGFTGLEHDESGRRFSATSANEATSANDVRYFDYDGSELLDGLPDNPLRPNCTTITVGTNTALFHNLTKGVGQACCLGERPYPAIVLGLAWCFLVIPAAVRVQLCLQQRKMLPLDVR